MSKFSKVTFDLGEFIVIWTPDGLPPCKNKVKVIEADGRRELTWGTDANPSVSTCNMYIRYAKAHWKTKDKALN
jgi:hypothetical protein